MKITSSDTYVSARNEVTAQRKTGSDRQESIVPARNEVTAQRKTGSDRQESIVPARNEVTARRKTGSDRSESIVSAGNEVTAQAKTWSDRSESMKDPVRFAEEWLGERPWQKQKEILRTLRDNRQVAVRSCNASGKTYAAAIAVIWWLMAHDEAVVITTAPSQRQVVDTLWREINNIWERNKELIGGKITSKRLELSNKRVAYGFATNTPERFQGFHSENILLIIDEASGVREFIFEAALGMMTSQNSKMLMIGNPSSLAGTFYDAFHKNREHWKTIHVAAEDTPNFKNKNRPESTENTRYIPGLATPIWAENILKTKGEESASYQVRVLGEFPDEADDTLIPLKHIEQAVEREIESNKQKRETAVMGLDVARFGEDQTVAVVKKGDAVVELATQRRSDLMNTTGKAIEIAKKHKVNIINVDEVGLGSGVVDRIRELSKSQEVKGIKAVGVNGGNKARNTQKFLNLRAQMFDGLRQRFADGEISIPNDPELISQLASITYVYNSRGQLQIETKQEIRASGRQSPDKADALALAFSTPVRPEIRMWIGQPRESERIRRQTRGR